MWQQAQKIPVWRPHSPRGGLIGQQGIRASPDPAVTSSEPEGTESISTKSRQYRQSTIRSPCSPPMKFDSMPASGRSLQRLSKRVHRRFTRTPGSHLPTSVCAKPVSTRVPRCSIRFVIGYRPKPVTSNAPSESPSHPFETELHADCCRPSNRRFGEPPKKIPSPPDLGWNCHWTSCQQAPRIPETEFTGLLPSNLPKEDGGKDRFTLPSILDLTSFNYPKVEGRRQAGQGVTESEETAVPYDLTIDLPDNVSRFMTCPRAGHSTVGVDWS